MSLERFVLVVTDTQDPAAALDVLERVINSTAPRYQQWLEVQFAWCTSVGTLHGCPPSGSSLRQQTSPAPSQRGGIEIN